MTQEEIKNRWKREFPAIVGVSDVWFATCKRFKTHCTLLDMNEPQVYLALVKKLLDKAKKAGFTKVNIRSLDDVRKEVKEKYGVII